MSEVCQVHGEEFKYIPAGVSKRTGNPYKAFYACPVRGCREKPVGFGAQMGVDDTSEPKAPQSSNLDVVELKSILKDALDWQRGEIMGELNKMLNELRLEFTKKIAENLSDEDIQKIADRVT